MSVPGITFVTAVEAGAIERKAVRMVDSLRRYGGRHATSPVIFVKPRPGPSLARQTYAHMERLRITLVQAEPHPTYSWYNFMNKPVSLVSAAAHTKTETTCWIDDDFLVLDDLPLLELGDEYDFAACASDLNVGTTGPGSRFEAYWSYYCQSIGLTFEKLGWTTIHDNGLPARTYYNGGLVCFRSGTEFEEEYLRIVTKVLDNRFRSSTDGIYMHEQMAVGATARLLGLRIRELPWEYNVSNHALYDSTSSLTTIRAVHYHEALYMDYFPRFCSALALSHPDRVDYLVECGPLLPNSFGLATRLHIRFKRWVRSRRASQYLATCRTVETPA